MRLLAIVLVCGAMSGSAQAGVFHKAGLVIRRDVLRTRANVAVFAGRAFGLAEMAAPKLTARLVKVRSYQEPVVDPASAGSPLDSKLWRGSRVDDVGLASLKARGFTAVVGLTAERDIDKDARKIGIAHKRIPILDNSTPTIAQVKDFLAYVKAQKGKVYVHCEAGVGRTGIMVAAYRIGVEHWDVGRALAEAREHGLKLRNQVEFIRSLGDALKS
jgi:protein tyrosine phosphatase (PTP) superfamily phosphohydrolase (DUF442 family)